MAIQAVSGDIPQKARSADDLLDSDGARRKPVESQERGASPLNEREGGSPFPLHESPESEIDWPSAPRHQKSAVLSRLQSPRYRGLCSRRSLSLPPRRLRSSA